MRRTRLLAHATLLAAALAAGTAACGSPSSPANPAGHGTTAAATPSTPAGSASGVTKPRTSAVAGAGPLAGLTADQVATRAVTDTEKAPVVRIAGTGSDSGQTLTLDITLVRGEGCQGTISEGKAGSFRFVYDRTSFWVLPDEKFYQSQGATAAELAILNGKYLKVKANGSGLGAMVSVCSISSILGGFSSPVGLLIGAPSTFDGKPAVTLSDAGDTAYVYVSYTARPELLQLMDPTSGGGTMDFSYDSAAAITPPPASQVIDGSKYGF